MEFQTIKREVPSIVRKTNRDQAALASGEWAALPMTFADLLMQMFQPCQASMENSENTETENEFYVVQGLASVPLETSLPESEEPLLSAIIPNDQQFPRPSVAAFELTAANGEESETVSQLPQTASPVPPEMVKPGLMENKQGERIFNIDLPEGMELKPAVGLSNRQTDSAIVVGSVPEESQPESNIFADTQGRVALASRLRQYELPEEPQDYPGQLSPANEGVENVFDKAAVQNAVHVSQNYELLDQLCSEIKEKVSLGKQVFSMKLKPEALGEITIKLQEESGKTVLHITAANTQTTQLINNELPSLREILSPMQVRVQDASTQEQAGSFSQMANMQQHFGTNGQSFGQQQEYRDRGESSKSVRRTYHQETRLLEPVLSAVTDGLDTYV